MATKQKKDDGEQSSADVYNPAYVGVDDIYKNHADVTQQPLNSEDDAARAAEEQAKADEEARLSAGVGFRGFNPGTPHPTEAAPVGDDFNRRNRVIHEAMAASAAESLKSGSTDEDEASTTGTEPSAPPD